MKKYPESYLKQTFQQFLKKNEKQKFNPRKADKIKYL